MTSRERVLCVLNGEKPDRVAIDIGSTASGMTNPTFKRVKEYLGVTSEDLVLRPDESSAYYNDDILDLIGGDFRHVFLFPAEGYNPFKEDGTIVNEWGMEKKLVAGLTQGCSSPLADSEMEDIDTYPWPDPYDKGRIKGIRERAKYLYENTDYAIATRAVSHGFFELAWELRGMENLFVDMLVDKDYANKLLDKILEIQIGYYDALLTEVGEYVHVVETGDDYGSQKGPLMSPELFNEMIVPRRKKLNEFIKSKAPHVKIFHHTCGSVYHILDGIIESGVDILNPVQPSADFMDTYVLQEEFGDKLVFHGGIDEQTALIGTIEDLENEMVRRLESLGKNYKYIMAPTSNFQDDMPLENIVRFAEIAKKVGQYK